MKTVICQVCDNRMDRLGGIDSSPVKNYYCRKCQAHDYESENMKRKFFTKKEWFNWINQRAKNTYHQGGKNVY
jgi:hypothetical protein